MLTEDRKRIVKLHNLIVDKTLKKYVNKTFSTSVQENTEIYSGNEINIAVSGGFDDNSFIFRRNSSISDRVWDGIPFDSKRFYSNKFEKHWFGFLIWIKSIFYKSTGSPIKFFDNVKESIEKLEKIDEKMLYLDSVTESLRNSGQSVMLMAALNKKKILELEQKIKDSNFSKYITEENLLKFILTCKRGLVLDYVSEFPRIIPNDVLDKKNEADELCVFDNFLILHFDPTEKVKLIEKKDPILFGVIKNSDKLYFIADWIDEKCDLTYDKIIKELNIDEKLI